MPVPSSVRSLATGVLGCEGDSGQASVYQVYSRAGGQHCGLHRPPLSWSGKLEDDNIYRLKFSVSEESSSLLPVIAQHQFFLNFEFLELASGTCLLNVASIILFVLGNLSLEGTEERLAWVGGLVVWVF